MAETLDTTVDFLINGATDEKAKASLKDAKLINYFKEVEALPEIEKNVILKVVNALIRDYKTRINYLASLFILTTISLFISGCDNKEKFIQDNWAISSFHASFNLKTNGLDFNQDHSCDLPLVDINDRHTGREKGTWEYKKEKGKDYIIIKTENKYFNKKFQVINIKRYLDTVSYGYLFQMTIIADSISLTLTKADLNPKP